MATGCVVSRTRTALFVIDCHRAFSLSSLTLAKWTHESPWSGKVSCRHLATESQTPLDSHDQHLVMEYKRGLPQFIVPLPSTRRKCLFTLRPVVNTVGDLVHMIKEEDQAIGSVVVTTTGGIQIASSNTIGSLIEEDFKLTINETEFYVKAPPKPDFRKNEVDKLEEIRSLVNQLYTSLNVEEHVVKKEKELLDQLEILRTELEPLEKKKEVLDAMAKRKTTAMTWIGLSLMSVQFGILARLTWWEYSWDIMEPVTYFVTYGTAMAAYAYFVLTKQEYLLPDVRDRQHLISLHKKAMKVGLDLNHYNRLKDLVAQIEGDLSRLKDPINPYTSLQPTITSVKRLFPLRHSTPIEKTKESIFAIINSFRRK